MIWKIVHWAHWSLFWTMLVLLLWSLWPKKRRRQTTIAWDGARLRFPTDRIELWLQTSIGVWAVLASTEYFRHGFHKSWDFFIGTMLCVAGAASMIAIPESTVVSEEGITQVYWLGKNKIIRWEDIVEINTFKRQKMIMIRSASGTKIAYAGEPENRSQFLNEIKRHCGDQLPADFPREPLEESESH